LKGYLKADATYAIAVSECEQYDLFISNGHREISAAHVINNEGQRRGICKHVFYTRAICAETEKTQVRCRPDDEVSPPSANPRELVPPALVAPSFPLQGRVRVVIGIVFVYECQSINVKYIEERIVVEDVDMSSVRVKGLLVYFSQADEYGRSKQHTSRA